MFEFDMISSNEPYGIAKSISHQLWCKGHDNYIHYQPYLEIEINSVRYSICIDYTVNKIIVSSKH